MRLELSGYSWKNGEVIFKWFPGFKAKMESYFGDWKSDPPKIAPILSRDKRLCPVRAFKLYLEERPPARRVGPPGLKYPVWYLRKSAISCLVRETIKDSFKFGSCSHAGGFDENTIVKCHDLQKSACSYSRKYLDRNRKSLARRVGSKTFTTLCTAVTSMRFLE